LIKAEKDMARAFHRERRPEKKHVAAEELAERFGIERIPLLASNTVILEQLDNLFVKIQTLVTCAQLALVDLALKAAVAAADLADGFRLRQKLPQDLHPIFDGAHIGARELPCRSRGQNHLAHQNPPMNATGVSRSLISM